jgi:hypothetical protein
MIHEQIYDEHVTLDGGDLNSKKKNWAEHQWCVLERQQHRIWESNLGHGTWRSNENKRRWKSAAGGKARRKNQPAKTPARLGEQENWLGKTKSGNITVVGARTEIWDPGGKIFMQQKNETRARRQKRVGVNQLLMASWSGRTSGAKTNPSGESAPRETAGSDRRKQTSWWQNLRRGK